jgi:hypothetical protein
LYTFSHRRIPPRSDSPHEPVSVFRYRENTPFSFSTTLGTRADNKRDVGILLETVLKEAFTEFLNDNKEEIVEAIANKEEAK